ncbi:MAG TPA: GNAT family N-acetyltransferase, partial [Thermoanaerobaculia bacterium]
ATRSRNFRWNARDALRKSAAAGCRVVELTPETFSPDALVETFFELHFQRVPDSVLRRPLYMTVMREATPQLFRERKMRAFAVMQEERVIALDLCTTGNDSLGLWNGGFDNGFGAISPGRVLMHHCAHVIADEGIGEYDLLRGDQDYKRKWRTGVRGTWRYTNH